MRLSLTALGIALIFCASPSLAADDQAPANSASPVAADTSSLPQRPELASLINVSAQFSAPRRPFALPILYGGFVFLHGYDAYSTLTALGSGAQEKNPLMRGVTGSPVAFVALKAGLAAASIMGAECLWKDNHRAAAIAMMIASNGLMVAVAAHNGLVLQRAH